MSTSKTHKKNKKSVNLVKMSKDMQFEQMSLNSKIQSNEEYILKQDSCHHHLSKFTFNQPNSSFHDEMETLRSSAGVTKNLDTEALLSRIQLLNQERDLLMSQLKTQLKNESRNNPFSLGNTTSDNVS